MISFWIEVSLFDIILIPTCIFFSFMYKIFIGDSMDIFKILYLSLGSIIVLFILTKLMGNKEMSQLTMFDYIVGITIGSIAAEMATSLEDNFWEPLIAMIVYAFVTILIYFITSKSLIIRRFISGKSIILFSNGKLYRKNFKRAQLDINEFLMQCRINGYFNLNDICTAILEANGKISFLPIASKKPVTTEDLNLSIKQEKLVYNIIVDGKILLDNLKSTGNNLDWLYKELKKQGNFSIKNIFLATCDYNNNLSVYTKNNLTNKHEGFL